MNDDIVNELAPTGVLRAAINMSNFLLVTGKSANGDPEGVSPAMAKAIAAELEVECRLVPFTGPGEVADAIADDGWDIGNIAAEPERAKTINFSPAYCEIQATYLLPAESNIQDVASVDAPGNRIAVKARSAYDLWLTDNIKYASIIRTPTIDDSFDVFVRDKLEVLSGLRPKLLEQQMLLAGSRVLDESFTAIQQSIGCQPGKPAAADFLTDFVKRSKENGFIARLIEQYGVSGRLSVAGS